MSLLQQQLLGLQDSRKFVDHDDILFSLLQSAAVLNL